MTGPNTWLRYVTLESVGLWLWAGWTIDDDFAGIHHGRHAVLMRWAGEGEPK